MADPARYVIEPLLTEGNRHPDPEKVTLKAELYIERDPSGKWVKWSEFQDYKNGQRANRAEQTVIKLGLEVTAMRVRIEELTKAGDRLAKTVKRLARLDDEDPDNGPKVIKDWEEAKNA